MFVTVNTQWDLLLIRPNHIQTLCPGYPELTKPSEGNDGNNKGLFICLDGQSKETKLMHHQPYF